LGDGEPRARTGNNRISVLARRRAVQLGPGGRLALLVSDLQVDRRQSAPRLPTWGPPFGVAVIAALGHVIAPLRLGAGGDGAHDLVRGAALTGCERAQAGAAR
jgi:hypothetical protein